MSRIRRLREEVHDVLALLARFGVAGDVLVLAEPLFAADVEAHLFLYLAHDAVFGRLPPGSPILPLLSVQWPKISCTSAR